MSAAPQALAPAGRVERDRQIAEARDVEGLTWPAIAARFGIDERTAQRGYRRHVDAVAAGTVPEVDVRGAAARVVRIHLDSLARLEVLVAEAKGDNAGVGVLRTAASVGSSLLDVLARTGYLADPRDELLRRRIAQAEDWFVRTFIDEMTRAGLSDEAIDRVVGTASAAAGAATGSEEPAP